MEKKSLFHFTILTRSIIEPIPLFDSSNVILCVLVLLLYLGSAPSVRMRVMVVFGTFIELMGGIKVETKGTDRDKFALEQIIVALEHSELRLKYTVTVRQTITDKALAQVSNDGLSGGQVPHYSFCDKN